MGTALAGLAALAVAMGIGRFAFTPLLPLMQAEYGLSLAQGGWLAAANYAGYLAGALTAPRALLGIRGSVAAISLSTLAMAFVHDFPVQIALRAVAGIGSAWVLVRVSAALLPRLPRPELAGVVFAGVGAGIVAAGFICLALPSADDAWIALGVIALLGTALPALPAERTGTSPLAFSGTEWRLVVPYGVFGFGYILPATFLPAMARDALGDPALFGWAWPLFGAAAAASTLAAVRIARGNRRLWIAAQLVMAAGVAAPVALPGLPGILLAAICVGGTFVVITLAGMREAAGRGALVAAMTAAFAAGQITGPLLVAALHLGVGPSLLLASAALALTTPLVAERTSSAQR